MALGRTAWACRAALLFLMISFAMGVPVVRQHELITLCKGKDVLPRPLLQMCCREFLLRCPKDHPAAREREPMAVRVGGYDSKKGRVRSKIPASAIRPKKLRVSSLGGPCDDGFAACRPPLSCREGLCRMRVLPGYGKKTQGRGFSSETPPESQESIRNKVRNAANEANAAAALKETMKMTTDGRDRRHVTSDKKANSSSPDRDRADEQPDITVQGLSVSLNADISREALSAASRGRPDVYTEEELADAVLAESIEGNETCKNRITESISKAKTGSKQTVPPTKTVSGSNSARASESFKARRIVSSLMDTKIQPPVDETEDEQIADSIAVALERDTGTVMDERLLKVLDHAVTRAMDKYEDKALADGSLLINVDELASGKSSKVQVEVPERQRAVADFEAPPMDPHTRANSLNQQIYGALRAKLEKGISSRMLDAVTKALVRPGCGLSPVIDTQGRNNMPKGMRQGQEQVPCDVVRWLRANWFETSSLRSRQRPGSSGDSAKPHDEL